MESPPFQFSLQRLFAVVSLVSLSCAAFAGAPAADDIWYRCQNLVDDPAYWYTTSLVALCGGIGLLFGKPWQPMVVSFFIAIFFIHLVLKP